MLAVYESIKKLLTQIKATSPLIVNVTNLVSMDIVANGLLALGASPVMTMAEEEAEDLLSIASAAVINIGTLDERFVKLVLSYCEVANQKNLPLTLDPVGAGASQYRTRVCLDLLERFQFATVRGNAGEIMALAGQSHQTKGVESAVETDAAAQAAQSLSSKYPNTLIVVSGKIDLALYQGTMLSCDRGSPMLPKITGSGCLLTAVMAAFAAANRSLFSPLEAARDALFFYNVCGEKAAKMAVDPGTFKVHFLDALSCIPELGDYEYN